MNGWDDETARRLRATARREVATHRCGGSARRLERENCAACVLAGFGATDDGPAYSGWHRVYVQVGWPIPGEHRDAFAARLAEDSPYGAALRRDVETFGVSYVEEVER